MSCCKDNLLVYLLLKPEHKTDINYQKNALKVLVNELNYTTEQADLAIEFAKGSGRYLIYEGSRVDSSKLSLAFAREMVGIEVKEKPLK